MFMTMAFLGATCSPLELLPRAASTHEDAGISFSEDKTMYCSTKLLLLEREEQDGETTRRAAHRSDLEIELTKRTVPG